MQQQRARPDRISKPQRCGEAARAGPEVAAPPAPFVLAPTLFVPSGQEQGVAKVDVSVGEVLLQPQGLAVAGLGLTGSADIVQRGAQVEVRVSVAGSQA